MLAPPAALLAGGIYLLLQLSPQLTAICGSVFVVMWGATVLYGGYSRYSQRVAQDVLAGSTASADESFTASKVVRTFGTEQAEEGRYTAWLE